MKTIIYTQRVDFLKKINETRDSLDQRWIDIANKLKLTPIILPNTSNIKISNLIKKKPDLIVLTGGNDIFLNNKKNNNTSKKRDVFEIKLIKFAIKKNIPLLGVCRGMQIINIFFKGKISPVKNHVAKEHRIFYDKKHSKYFSEYVNSYHNWGIKKNELSDELIPIVNDCDERIECFIHKTKNIVGIMWHPERRKNKKDILIFKKIIEKKWLKL